MLLEGCPEQWTGGLGRLCREHSATRERRRVQMAGCIARERPPFQPVVRWVGVVPLGSSRSKPSGVWSLPGPVPCLPWMPYCQTIAPVAGSIVICPEHSGQRICG